MSAAIGGGRAFRPLVMDWVPPAELSPNSRAHWRVKARAIAQTRFLLYCNALRFWFECGKGEQQEGDPRRRLTITVTKPRESDLDNLTSSLKSVIDGVVQGGAARDDSPKWLVVVVRQVKGKPPSTRLELEEIEDGQQP